MDVRIVSAARSGPTSASFSSCCLAAMPETALPLDRRYASQSAHVAANSGESNEGGKGVRESPLGDSLLFLSLLLFLLGGISSGHLSRTSRDNFSSSNSLCRFFLRCSSARFFAVFPLCRSHLGKVIPRSFTRSQPTSSDSSADENPGSPIIRSISSLVAPRICPSVVSPSAQSHNSMQALAASRREIPNLRARTITSRRFDKPFTHLTQCSTVTTQLPCQTASCAFDDSIPISRSASSIESQTPG